MTFCIKSDRYFDFRWHPSGARIALIGKEEYSICYTNLKTPGTEARSGVGAEAEARNADGDPAEIQAEVCAKTSSSNTTDTNREN